MSQSRRSQPSPVRLLTATLCALGMSASASTHAQQVNLTISTWYGADQAKIFNQAVAEYERANPTVKITHTTVAGTGAANYLNVLRTSIAGGRAPDLFNMYAGTLARPFIDAGFAADLSAYYRKYNWNSSFIPSAVKATVVNGKPYGVPIDLRAISLFYRKDVLATAKVTVPRTFAQLEAACSKLAAQNITCLATGGTFGWHAMRYFDFLLEHTAGPDLHDQLLANKVSWNRPEVVRAFTLMKEWTDKKYFPNGFMGLAPTQAAQSFQQGRAAFILEGDWFVPQNQLAGLKPEQFGFMPAPSNHKPARLEGFAEQMMISAQSRNKDAAAAFLHWWSLPATQKKYYAVNGSTATKNSLPSRAANPAAYDYGQMVAKSETYPILDQSFTAEFMNTTFFRLQSSVVAGQIKPADAARQMQVAVDAMK